ncbi:MAG TPA: hypothetical protein VGQ37_26610 [Vicinamibacterales bacterium]|jgi:hypothetical protein|nr:hypothetical protein [Vicinamibacterales bacterium]
MHRTLGLLVAALLFAWPLLIFGQREEANPQRPSVQVGVPEGRSDRGGAANASRGRGRPSGPPRAVPRGTDGHVLLGGATPTEKGVWLPGPVVPNPLQLKDIPFQPWAKALFADRNSNELEPHTRCKPSGVARQFLTPYGVEMVELRELQRVFVFDIGGPHTFREVFMDGRSHPKDFTPTYYGHSIGWWEDDTMVVDTVGFNEGFWMDRDGLPHTSQMHTIEKFTRTDFNTIRYQLTVDDPGAYTAPWTGQMNLRWEAGTELFEYQCQQMNYASELMVGQFEKVDRSSLTVP